jgi:hypothetical protein
MTTTARFGRLTLEEAEDGSDDLLCPSVWVNARFARMERRRDRVLESRRQWFPLDVSNRKLKSD